MEIVTRGSGKQMNLKVKGPMRHTSLSRNLQECGRMDISTGEEEHPTMTAQSTKDNFIRI